MNTKINQLVQLQVVWSDMLPVWYLVLFFIFLVLYLKWNRRGKTLPPGPWGIPLLGILPFMNKTPVVKFQEFYKKYGNICSFYIGQSPVVLLSDYETIKEALIKQHDVFSGRPYSFQFRVYPEDNGIVTTDGAVFRKFKSFIVSTLKEFGARKRSFEAIVKINAEHFVDYLHTTNGEPVDLLEPLGLSIAQTYCDIIFGKRFDFEDSTFKELISLFHMEQRCYNNGVRMFLPWTRKVPGLSKLVGEDRMRYIKGKIFQHLDKIVSENENEYTDGSKMNFIHSWLTEVKNCKLENPEENIFTRRTLLHNMDILFCAGYETTTVTLLWALLFLVKNPEAQKKLIREVDEVVGHDRIPSMDDAVSMPYTLAVIQEVHRCASIAPLAAPHRNTSSASLNGYHIPKSSYIYLNIFAVHNNPDNFPEPECFKPERFLDGQGKFKRDEKVIAFSLGKRQCPGDQLAHVEIFLYLTHVMQHFHIEKASQHDSLASDRIDNVVVCPSAFKIRLMKRI